MKKTILTFLSLIAVTLTFGSGVMVKNSCAGEYMALHNTTVDVNVQHQVATVTCLQSFKNQFDETDIKYLFPMPEGASATQLRYYIGGEWFTASFSSDDQDTTLPGGGGGCTEDPNLVTYRGSNSLYFEIAENIANGDTLQIELTYVQLLSYKHNVVSFDFPSDYSNISSSPANGKFDFNFNVTSERTIESIDANGFGITTSLGANYSSADVFFYETALNENIHVDYSLATGELGVIDFSTFLPDSLTTCDEEENGFLGLIIEPESGDDVEVLNKVFTLVIDKSGSMGGNKIVQARDAASFIVNNLNEGDFFNIVDFSTGVSSFHSTHVEFNENSQSEALNYISTINATGGTNINGAMIEAVDQFTIADDSKANIIIFFTDGQATSGETSTDGILSNLESKINEKETEIYLFTFGIGSNTNEALLTQMALQNNGLVEFLGNDEVEERISEFYLTIRNPVMINTQVTFSPNIVQEVLPNPYPNLYKGKQLILVGRYPQGLDSVTVTLTGKAFSKDVTYEYKIGLADSLVGPNSFLPKLWSKKKIEDLTNQYYLASGMDKEELKSKIEDLSVCYQVISEFTSFTQDNSNNGNQTMGLFEDLFETEKVEAPSFYPNPFSSVAELTIELRATSMVTINVYDANGTFIRSLTFNGVFGANSILWDGLDKDGNLVETGLYMYEVITDQQTMYGKILKN